MKCKLIVDSLGPNPAYRKPERYDFKTEEEWHDAVALYDVPSEITVPAGTILSGGMAWMHCFPDASGVILTKQRDPHDRKIKLLPTRAGVGVVRAVPEDDACRAALERQIVSAAAARRVRVEYIRQELAQAVQTSLDQQAENDKAREVEAPSEVTETATTN